MARRALGPAALAVVQAVDPWLRARPGQPILVACSGGADSMALAAAVAHLSGRDPQLAGRVRARVIDHGLQFGSAEVAKQVVARLVRLGLAAEVRRVEVDQGSPAGLEASARAARYQGLAADLAGGTLVLLGHTLDDQAETVLLGLARGSGTRSLAGMPDRFSTAELTGTPDRPSTGECVQFGRPLLGLRRSATAAACREWMLPVWHDPHNFDKRYRRVRVRTSVLPTLEAELGPGIAEALARTATLARADADELDAQAVRLMPAADESLPVSLLCDLSQALASRVLRGWLIGGGVPEPTQAHTQAVWALVDDWRGQTGVDLPGGKRAVRRRGALWLDDTPPAQAPSGG